MRNAFVCAVLVLTALAVPGFGQSVCDAVSGNLVQNCGFETGNFTDWTVNYSSDGGSDLYISSNAAYIHSGGYGAVFAASGPASDSISQVISTTSGHTYQLNFWLENHLTSGEAGFWAYWDGTQIYSASTTAFGYTDFTFNVTGTGSDTLKFAGLQPPSAFALDDVELTAQSSAPETSSILLLGTILLAIVGVLRRARRSA